MLEAVVPEEDLDQYLAAEGVHMHWDPLEDTAEGLEVAGYHKYPVGEDHCMHWDRDRAGPDKNSEVGGSAGVAPRHTQ